MKLYALVGILSSLAMLVLMNIVFVPIMDNGNTSNADRLMLTITMVFPLYFLFFSVKVGMKAGGIIKWMPEEENDLKPDK